ncbi:MAG: pyridoxal 5'-phosphate synthase glutaminase subunit PdxT [Acidimicrobiia bacterium]|nr:pyridoxal 5'-phosphate synthase glutaminase subunit PdxT [Acidimicrobiia bacterium]
MSELRVGVLALQGDFREHIAMVRSIGATAFEVRTPDDLAQADALIIPGGESTAIGRLARIYGMIDPMRSRIESGLPVLGTCAGMIFLGSATTGNDQPQLGVLDVVVERNAFGRQVDSFESEFEVTGFDGSMHAVFIRAPWIHKVGADVEILAAVTDPSTGDDRPVFVRQANILATSFHPELTDDTRVHEALLAMAEER